MEANLTYFGLSIPWLWLVWSSHDGIILTILGQTRANTVLTIVTTVNMVEQLNLPII